MVETILFSGFATLTVIPALGVLFAKKIMHAAFALLLTLLGVAGLFVLAGAGFVGVTQMLVYVGGILVLILFGIMLTQRQAEIQKIKFSGQAITGGLLGLSLMAVLGFVLFQVDFEHLPWIETARKNPMSASVSVTALLGKNLLTFHLLPFEISAVLLLLALAGGAFVAKK
jgi:NADH:ubiquinone oxidoreductase subunit 6 (subunit J)